MASTCGAHTVGIPSDRRPGGGLVRRRLELVRQIAHAHDAKVNDILLAVTASGLRGLLHSRGELVNDLVVPVYVPVTLRQTLQRARARET